jgi:hypothetical protein
MGPGRILRLMAAIPDLVPAGLMAYLLGEATAFVLWIVEVESR